MITTYSGKVRGFLRASEREYRRRQKAAAMETVFIRFATQEDRVRGFCQLATRSRISSFPGRRSKRADDIMISLFQDRTKAIQIKSRIEFEAPRCEPGNAFETI